MYENCPKMYTYYNSISVFFALWICSSKIILVNLIRKSLKISKGDNQKSSFKRQITVDTILHRKGWATRTPLINRGELHLFPLLAPIRLPLPKVCHMSWIQKERNYDCDKWNIYISGQLWRRHSVTVNELMLETFKLSMLWLQLKN